MTHSARMDTTRDWWRDGSLLSPMRTVGSAAIAAAGPWIVAVFALGIISATMDPTMGLAAVEDMRLTVVYAFCLAPLAANPVGVVAARRIAAHIEQGTPDPIPGIYLSACALAGVASFLAAIGLSLWIGLGPFGIVAGFVFLTAAAAQMWTSFAVLGALRDTRFLIWAFSGGMALSVACILFFARSDPTTELLIWCFVAGCLLCVALTAGRVLGHGTLGYAGVFPAARILMTDLRRNRALCLGVMLATAAVWADKWWFWFSPEGVRSQAGFLHYPAYDSVMFLAHLSIIPSLAAMLMFHDGDLTRAVRTVQSDLAQRANLAEVEAKSTALTHMAWSRIIGIVFLQATIAAACVLMAPLVTSHLKFSFDQFVMLRVGLIAVFLYTIFNLSCALLIVCNRIQDYALLQGGFLLANLGLSLGFYLSQGTTAYPFFLSSLTLAAIALLMAGRAMGRYLYLSVLGANDSLVR